MPRSLSSVWLLLSAPIALAAPAKKADRPPAYFPTVVGATAVYKATAGKLSMETTDRVTEVATTRDGLRVTVERASDSGVKATTYQTDVSATGLIQVRFGNRDNDPPMPMLRLPAKAGDTWEWEAQKADGVTPRKIKFKVAGEEEVEVPAGKFKAIRVEQEEEVRGRPSRTEEWYALGVGLVKRVFDRGAVKQVVELQSFTPGKE